MINVDPEKLSKMAESLFSPGLGRFFNRVIFLSFLVAVVSGAALLLFDQLIGKVLWPFLTSVFGNPASGISLDNLESIIILLGVSVAFFVAMFSVLVFVAVGTFRRRVVSQPVIDETAEYRSEGIKILNRVPASPEALPEWEGHWRGWSERVTEFLAKHFTKAEMLSFRRLGLVPENRFSFAVTPEHAHYLMQLAKQITILENLIQKHQERH